MAIQFGGNRAQGPIQTPRPRQGPSISGLQAVAAGIQEASRGIAQGIKDRRDLDLKLADRMRQIQMAAAQSKTPDSVLAGNPILEIGGPGPDGSPQIMTRMPNETDRKMAQVAKSDADRLYREAQAEMLSGLAKPITVGVSQLSLSAGHPELVKAMREVGGLTPEQLRLPLPVIEKLLDRQRTEITALHEESKMAEQVGLEEGRSNLYEERLKGRKKFETEEEIRKGKALISEEYTKRGELEAAKKANVTEFSRQLALLKEVGKIAKVGALGALMGEDPEKNIKMTMTLFNLMAPQMGVKPLETPDELQALQQVEGIYGPQPAPGAPTKAAISNPVLEAFIKAYEEEKAKNEKK